MSRLLENSEEFRKQQITKNTYDKNNEFTVSHPNALSDGDAKGKGEDGGTVGSSVDIQQRKTAATKNRYSLNDPYNISNA